MKKYPTGVKMGTKKQALYYIVNIRKRITTCYPNNQYEQIDMPQCDLMHLLFSM